MILLSISIFFSIASHYLTIKTVKRTQLYSKENFIKKPKDTFIKELIIVFLSAIFVLLLIFLSFIAIYVTEIKATSGETPFYLIKTFLIHTATDFTEKEISTKPVNWTGKSFESNIENSNSKSKLISNQFQQEVLQELSSISKAMEIDEIALVKGANLKGRNLIRLRAEKAFLVKSDLREANLERANLYDANLQEANLQGANLNGANLEGANLNGANLEGANLNGANLEGANLENTLLIGADLQGTNLCLTNFLGAKLQGANLRGANLMGANLQGANLQGADLRRINFTGVNFQEANLFEANLEGARSDYISSNSLIGYSGFILCGTSFRGAQLSNVNLKDVTGFCDARCFEGTTLINVTGIDQEDLEYLESRGAIIK